MPEVFIRRAFSSAETSTYSEYFFTPAWVLGSFIFEMATAFAKVKMVFSADSNQNSSIADMKHSSSFYFASGHSALWQFNCNPRDPTMGFISLLLGRTCWGKRIGLGSDCTSPPLWSVNTDQYYFFFDVLYVPATRRRLQNSENPIYSFCHDVLTLGKPLICP